MNLGRGDAGVDTGREDLRGEIDLVGGWPNAGGELYHEIRGIAAEGLVHPGDHCRRDLEFGSLFPGVGNTAGSPLRVDEKHRSAVGDPDAKKLTGSRGDEGIVRGKMHAARMAGYHTDVGVVNLFAGGEMLGGDAET